MSGNLAVSTINGVDISVSQVATQAFATGQDLGVGQTWQDVTASRSAGVTYTNTTGKPISFSVRYNTTNTSSFTYLEVNGTQCYWAQGYTAGGYDYTLGSIVVPNGATYKLVLGSGTLSKWSELR